MTSVLYPKFLRAAKQITFGSLLHTHNRTFQKARWLHTLCLAPMSDKQETDPALKDLRSPEQEGWGMACDFSRCLEKL